MNIDLKNIHILVVEDIQSMRDLLSHMLGMLGVGRVTLSQNGADVGPLLENELDSACSRYMNTKAKIMQQNLKKTANK